MRECDLIPCFVSLLDDLEHEQSSELVEIKQRMEDESYYDTEDADFDLEWLFDALNDHAPDGYHFGAHEGDGSDYGFWLNSDEYNE